MSFSSEDHHLMSHKLLGTSAFTAAFVKVYATLDDRQKRMANELAVPFMSTF